MTPIQFANRICNIDDDLLQATFHTVTATRLNHKRRRILVFAAAILTLLAICGFAVHELGLLDDLWIQAPASDPIKTVQSAIENETKKEYTRAVRVDLILTDEAETARKIEEYTGSELAAARGWSDEYLQEHFIAVRAKYYVEYDHAKTFLEDGLIDRYFYLVKDTDTGKWTIVDNSTNGEPGARSEH